MIFAESNLSNTPEGKHDVPNCVFSSESENLATVIFLIPLSFQFMCLDVII